ncbi:proteoglycan 4-like [Thunnus albacares]|uniref:proteoglycan 4-like n=1 Tax=Thunnus albacares TaxID=8236 RepID=UPI001CF6E388|nr:proteoglycan 4-like [Thunnus albacares]
MTSHNLCPYGLKSLLECITRAALLSQPGDNPDFLFEYLSELINFRRCHPEDDPKIVSFNYQEMWENKFLGTKKASKTPITASAAAPQVPSQAEVEETLKELYLDLASSTDGNVVKKPQKERMPTNKTSGKDKKPSASPMYPTPTPPPRVGRQHGKNVPPPFLVVKGERKPAPPPRNVSMKTRRVSSVKVPIQQESKGTCEDVRKTPQTRRRTLTPIPAKSSEPEKVSVSVSRVASKPAKPSSVPIPIVTHKLVLPPIPQRKKQDGQVSVVQGKAAPTKPRKSSPMNREVMPDETSSRPPVRKARGPLKAKAKAVPKTAPVPGPESTKEPGPERPRETTPAPPTDPKPEKKRIRPDTAPEKTRAPRILRPLRARVKPVENRTVEGIQGTAFGRPGSSTFNNTHPHLAHVVHIIRYRRMQIRSSSQGHSGPSLN